MGFLEEMQGLFGAQQAQTGAPLAPSPPTSNFFATLLGGAVRGTEQALSTSSVGTNIQGFLTQGQSQVAAMNLFGNPLILLGVAAIAGYFIIRTFAK